MFCPFPAFLIGNIKKFKYKVKHSSPTPPLGIVSGEEKKNLYYVLARIYADERAKRQR